MCINLTYSTPSQPMSEKQQQMAQHYRQRFETLAQGEYELLNEYMGRNSQVHIYHRVCQTSYWAHSNSFLRGGRCRHCYDKRRRKDPNQFKAEWDQVIPATFELLEPYETNRIPLKIKHLTCGHTFGKLPIAFLKYPRCPHCSSITRTPKRVQGAVKNHFIKRLSDETFNEFQLVGDYKNLTTPTTFYRPSCGHEFIERPDLLIERMKCPICFPKKQSGKRKTPERFEQEVLAIGGFKVLTPYQSAQNPVELQHECGYQFQIKPTYFLSRPKCPICK